MKTHAAFVLALLVVTGCTRAPSPGTARRVIQPVVGTWAMYQRTPDRNAVIRAPFAARTWETDLGARTNGGIALAGGLIFVDTFGRRVFALDAATGRIRWSTRLSNIAMSTPVVAEGRVYVGTGKNERGMTTWSRKAGDDIVALDAATGSTLWTYHTVGEDMPSVAYAGGIVVFANGDGHAYGLHAGTGTLAWRTRLPGLATMSSALAVGDAAIFSTCSDRFSKGETVRVDVNSGSVDWIAPYGSCDSSPAFAGGRVYVSGIDGMLQDFGFGGRAVVAALSAQSGKPMWIYRSPNVGSDTEVGSAERAVSGMYSDGTYFQAIPGEDAFIAFNAATGAVRWRATTLAPVKMSAIASADRVYFGDTAGLLYAVSKSTGFIWRRRPFREPFSTSPLVLFGRTMFIPNGASLSASPVFR